MYVTSVGCWDGRATKLTRRVTHSGGRTASACGGKISAKGKVDKVTETGEQMSTAARGRDNRVNRDEGIPCSVGQCIAGD